MIEGQRSVEAGGWLWDVWRGQNGEPGTPAPRVACRMSRRVVVHRQHSFREPWKLNTLAVECGVYLAISGVRGGGEAQRRWSLGALREGCLRTV